MQQVGNPSSVHRHGRQAPAGRCARAGGTAWARIRQTHLSACGTEANALALRASRGRVLVSAVEHASVLGSLDDTETIPVDADGLVRLDALEEMLADSDQPALISVMLANNETGVLQPIREIAMVARRYGALVHCDAVQAAGRIALDGAAQGVQLLSLSAHKLGGPAGVGALVVDPSVPLSPPLRGGGQERGRRRQRKRAGHRRFRRRAEAAAGCGDSARLASLRDGLERRLKAICPRARLFGADAPRLPNTSCIGMPGVTGETQVIAFDLASVSVSAGAACSSASGGQPRAEGHGRWRGYCSDRRSGEHGLDHECGGRGPVCRGLERHLRSRAGAAGGFGARGGRGGVLVSER